MKLGLQIPSFTWPGGAERTASTLARIAQAAEEAGFSQPLGHGPLLPDRNDRQA